jgi:hypothetical protein
MNVISRGMEIRRTVDLQHRANYTNREAEPWIKTKEVNNA